MTHKTTPSFRPVVDILHLANGFSGTRHLLAGTSSIIKISGSRNAATAKTNRTVIPLL
jgi:hypothetical protein